MRRYEKMLKAKIGLTMQFSINIVSLQNKKMEE